MPYVDGFVIPVPKANREAYRSMAERVAAIFREHGALKVVECWGDDVPEGKLTSFPLAVKTDADEAVVFSWVIWPSKAARDAGNTNVFSDPRMEEEPVAPLFDGKRLIMGGFEMIVDA